MASMESAGRTRAPRGPGVLYTALAVVMVVVLAFVLVTVPHDPPPAIAEIAPQAVQHIDEPPPEQAIDLPDDDLDLDDAEDSDRLDSSQEGADGDGAADGDGGTAGDEGGAAPDVPLEDGDPVLDEEARQESPTTRRCIKGPDGRLRQTEDPQSPPCVAFWDRTDNGGATYHGVTETEIRIAVPSLGQDHPYLLAYQGFFNRRFEFYGRQLRLIGLHDPSRPAGAPSAQIQRAEEVVREHDVFASTSGFEHGGVYFGKRLAELERLYAVAFPNWTEDTLRTPLGSNSRFGPGLHPYVWQYEMGWDRQFSAAAQYACDRLADREPAWHEQVAGLPLGDGAPDVRRFGVIFNDVYGPYLVDAAEVATRLEACQGGDSNVPIRAINVEEQGTLAEQQMSNAMAHMRSQGVTTIVCLCNAQIYVTLTRLAPVDYRPEWFLSGYSLNQLLVFKRGPELVPSADRDHLRRTFGFSAVPRHVNAADDPSLQALVEGNPRVWNSGSDVSAQRENALHLVYRSLLVLASGIQMAGPDLTPETFERGLQNADFPNPNHPINAGRVHFLGGSRTMTLDLVEYYWGDGDNGPYAGDPRGLGAWCYPNGGPRMTIGEWSSSEPEFFVPGATCDSGRQPRGG